MTDTSDSGSAFADLLDELLDALQNGDEPDLTAAAARHPTVAARIDEAYTLACGVAGRRENRQPSLRGYRILRELGRGGMGTVYLARQEQLDREVALKVLPHSFGLSAASRQRFLNEAKALARVHHEHIVGIHRIVDDGDLLAFEMEYVDGPSLQAVLAHLRAVREASGATPTLQHLAELLQLPIEALGAQNLTQFFVRITRQIARALGEVHAAGFVHRDVKPANVLLRKNGQPVLADFGLVRDTDLERSHKTGFAGTPVYSSPEQLRGDGPVGPPTDVYALAVTLYECLTLQPPFAGRTTTDLLSRIETGRVPPLRQHAPQAPRDLETIVAHAMELEPERRYAHGGAFADDLQRLLDLQPILARPASLLRRSGKFLRRNRLPLFAGCMGALLVAALFLPFLGHVEAAERDQQAAREHVRLARQALLSPDCRRAAWQHAVWGNVAPVAAGSQQTAASGLQQAIDAYQQALARRPDDDLAGRELAVTRMLQWLRQLSLPHADSLVQALATPEYRALAAALPPLARRVAAAIAAGRTEGIDVDAELPNCSETDRACVGLLTFLLGEFRWCELAWNQAGADAADQPLRDAALGLIYLADGAPERAYVRLQAAQRELPEATLALELADAALAMGETTLAANWLAKVPEQSTYRDSRLRVAADLQVATGDEASAASTYQQLVVRNPLDPTPRHRIVQLAMRNGELGAAAAQLDALLQQWPGMASLRLDRARIALQQRDVPAYLRQVLATLTLDGPRHSSAGATADSLEVLRLGGLTELHRTASVAARGSRSGRAFLGGEIPLRGMLPVPMVDELEALLPSLVDLDRQIRGVYADWPRIDGIAGWLTVSLPLAWSRLPGLANSLSLPQRLICEATPWLARMIHPRLQPLVQLLLIPLVPSEWSVVQLQAVRPPNDLDPSHVFGSALVRGADWNGDGVDEVLIGCEPQDPTKARGRVLVVDGRSAQILAEATTDSEQHMFGHSLALVGDLDDDGRADWLVGAPAGTQATRQGFAELRSGGDQHVIARITGDAAAFGVDVAGLGDVDADGSPDFAVATPPIVRNATGQGCVTMFSGRTRRILRVLTNDLPGVWFGASIADAGDTDGDGVHDLAVGGNFGGAPGNVRLYSGRTGAVLQTWRDDSTSSGFGTLVAGVGDLDGDGSGDLAVSAIRLDADTGPDQVHLFSGRTGRRIATISGERPNSRFGTSVVRYDAPRRNAPLLLAIGASLGGSSSCGSIEFWTPAGAKVSSLQGPRAFSGFGGWIASVNDLDGDGRAELFVAGPRANRDGSAYRVDSGSIRFGRQ